MWKFDCIFQYLDEYKICGFICLRKCRPTVSINCSGQQPSLNNNTPRQCTHCTVYPDQHNIPSHTSRQCTDQHNKPYCTPRRCTTPISTQRFILHIQTVPSPQTNTADNLTHHADSVQPPNQHSRPSYTAYRQSTGPKPTQRTIINITHAWWL